MDDLNVARLLAPPGRLSSVEKDAIFDRIAPQPRAWHVRFRLPAFGAVLALAAAAALVPLVVWPHATSAPVARGAAGLPLVLRCGLRAPGECAIGDRLTIDFGATPPDGYLGLLARAPDQTVLWYVPGDTAAPTPLLASHTTVGVLDTVIHVDRNYAPGRYTLYAIVSDAPMSRDDIRGLAQGDHLTSAPGVTIVERSFDVTAGTP